MLAGALAAIHLDIPVAHIHGGERSGTVDEPVRHAISKLAHLHLVATQGARERLIRMGERGRVHPGRRRARTRWPDRTRGQRSAGLVRGDGTARRSALGAARLPSRSGRRRSAPPSRPGHDRRRARRRGNPDPGADAELGCRQPGVREVLPGGRSVRDSSSSEPISRRPEFISWLACCDVMVGNSSSGIIEAASFGTPVVNVGSRQNLRERNANVVDVECDAAAVARRASRRAGRRPRRAREHLWRRAGRRRESSIGWPKCPCPPR